MTRNAKPNCSRNSTCIDETELQVYTLVDRSRCLMDEGISAVIFWPKVVITPACYCPEIYQPYIYSWLEYVIILLTVNCWVQQQMKQISFMVEAFKISWFLTTNLYTHSLKIRSVKLRRRYLQPLHATFLQNKMMVITEYDHPVVGVQKGVVCSIRAINLSESIEQMAINTRSE